MEPRSTTPVWLASCPSASLASTNRLASLGVGIGPGVNPNAAPGNPSFDLPGKGAATQNNPPIVNTGNNGPMCVQPGDWVCSSCGFVNWRRRRVCMRCFPFADTSEMSNAIANGAFIAAQLAAGIEPCADAISSLAQPTRRSNSAGSILLNGEDMLAKHSCPSALPPRPDTSHIRHPVIESNGTSSFLQSRVKSCRERDQTVSEDLCDMMRHSLSLQAGLRLTERPPKSPENRETPTASSRSSAFHSPLSHHQVVQCPSLPVLTSRSEKISSGRDIWATGLSLKTPESQASPCLGESHPLYPPTYQQTHKLSSGDFSNLLSQGVSPSFSDGIRRTKGGWQDSLESRFALKSTLGLYSEPASQNSLRCPGQTAPKDDLLLRTPLCGPLVPDHNIKNDRPSLGKRNEVVDSEDVPLKSPLLSKSQAIIQPPALSRHNSDKTCGGSVPAIILSSPSPSSCAFYR
ncbi:hypothetical protein CBS101457_002348 [Exobasidium rhododendri]|nr:hypothetical protein CBS101457_002348 [Exobasidium rhododendri]